MQKLAVLLLALACVVSSSALAQEKKIKKSGGDAPRSQAERCCVQFGGVFNKSTQFCTINGGGPGTQATAPYLKCAGRL
jgi:hypothetical protein